MALARDSRGRFVSNSSRSTKKNRPITYYTLVLDKSSSMESLRAAAVQACNDRLKHIRRIAKDLNQDIYVSFIQFSTQVDKISPYRHISQVRDTTLDDYRTDGSTALFDGTGDAIEHAKRISANKNTAFLIEVITDGEENNSSRFGAKWKWNDRYSMGMTDIVQLIQEVTNRGDFTVLFQLPSQQYKNSFVNNFGIPENNINVWETTVVGTQEASTKTCAGFDTYFTGRSAGLQSTQTFYADVDLEDLKKSDVTRNLTDLSYKFTEYEVKEDCAIKDFTEKKTHKEYVVGQTSYELRKVETVQDYKDIYIQKRGESKIYGGKEARDLLGLPHTGNVKVNPVNLSNWRIFIESTSVNRKLRKGERVIIDKNRKVSKRETWASGVV